MSNNNLQSLVSSLEVLRESVVKAENLVQQVDPKSKIRTNLSSYLAVCSKQIEFAKLAELATNQQETEKALNYINLIEELANLVKEDAESLLSDHTNNRIDYLLAH